MNLAKKKVLVIILLVFISTNVYADTIICPQEIMVEQKLTSVSPQWQYFDSQKQHPFTTISISEGPPTQQAILVPSKQIKNAKHQMDIWEFSNSALGYWISCEYGGTSIALYQKLNDGIKSCEVEYDPVFSSPQVKNVVCK